MTSPIWFAPLWGSLGGTPITEHRVFKTEHKSALYTHVKNNVSKIDDKMKYPEFHIQTAINNLLSRAQTCLYFHVPNRPKNAIEWHKQEAMGALAGVADLVFPAEGSRFLELKAPGGKQSPAQKMFEASCHEYGMEYAMAKSFDEAYEQIKKWGYV